MTWASYLKVLSVAVMVVLVSATYRDLIDDENDSVFTYASRIVLFPAMAYGLYRRNRWAVRIAYNLGILTLAAVALLIVIRGPTFPISVMVFMCVFLTACAITVLIPRSVLTPQRNTEAPAGPPSPASSPLDTLQGDNPYRPPQPPAE